MADEEPGLPTSVRMPIKYVNAATVTLTPEETIIRFSIRGVSDVDEPVVAILMSHTHLKRLMTVLAQQLEIHEEIFGHVPNHPVENISPEVLNRLIAEGKVVMPGVKKE